MTRKKGLPSKMAQISYEHKKLNSQFLKVKKSTEELQGILQRIEMKNKKK